MNAYPTPAELAETWRDHVGADRTTHPEIATGCVFGSPLRTDVCHPSADS